jgi:hypothetical protein
MLQNLIDSKSSFFIDIQHSTNAIFNQQLFFMLKRILIKLQWLLKFFLIMLILLIYVKRNFTIKKFIKNDAQAPNVAFNII